MVYDQGTIYNLIFPVMIQVIYGKSVITLGFCFTIYTCRIIIGIKFPSQLKLIADSVVIGIHKIISGQAGSGIVSTAEHSTGLLTIQISNC
ncbi:hypothetical protein D3C81_1935580 [compost metagenome]